MRLGWTDGILCLGATFLALTAGRNVSTFAVIVTPVVTYPAHAALDERGRGLRLQRTATIPVALANLVIIAVVLGIATGRVSRSFVEHERVAEEKQTLPVEAVDYLRAQGVRGRLFNEYAWGGYLIHQLPAVPVFVDGRSDLYGGAFLANPYQQLEGGGPGWQQMLDRYGVGTVLVSRTSGLAYVLAADPAWRWVHTDRLAAVFERRTS